MGPQCHTTSLDSTAPGDGRPPHPEASRSGQNRVREDILLDAAKACVLAVGVRRTTLAEVARRAGVSRMTLYRRFPDVTGLVATLLTRELGTLLLEISDRAAALDTARRRLVACAVGAVRHLTDNPLLRTVLEIDPELLLPYLVQRVGSTQRLAEQFLREQVLAGHADGSVRRGDAPTQARMLFLNVQAVLFSLRLAPSDSNVVDATTLLAELEHTLDAMLRPVTPSSNEPA